MLKKIAKVILAFKRRLIKKLKKRSPIDRFKARSYYRKHKSILKIRRKRYMQKAKPFMKSKKYFKRSKPLWLSKKRPAKPKFHIKKFKKPAVKKFHAPRKPKFHHTPKRP